MAAYNTQMRVTTTVLLMLLTAGAAMAQQSPAILFQDISAQAGLTVAHISTAEKRYIIESMSGGVALLDCNNDGNLDIAVANGSTVERMRNGGDPMVTLYRQEAPLRFANITAAAGLARRGWGMGVYAVDYDNDGITDLLVTGYGGNALYHGLGNCRFEDVTDKAGVKGSGFMTGAAWGDYDRDGRLDLFVAGYVHVPLENLPKFGTATNCRYRGIAVQCGPTGLEGEPDLLFHNRGDGTFEEVSRQAGVDDKDLFLGMQPMWADLDQDGWPDLVVANDSTPNYLYHNRHNGTFEEIAMEAGLALSLDGRAQGSMGVTLGDYDHDGRLDLFFTNFVDQSNALYRNLGNNNFQDETATSGIAGPSTPYVAWATSFVDFDNDTWPDLLISDGHVYPQMETAEVEAAGYRQPILLFRNNGNGTFSELSQAAGLRRLPLMSRRGAAFGDLNNDGLVDVVILNADGPPTVLLNTTRNANHWISIRCVGTASNRDGVGARVTVRTSKLAQVQEVTAGSSYLSQNDLRLHFGLGPQDHVDAVEIRWPSGKAETVRDLEADRFYTITEGNGVTAKQAGGWRQAAHREQVNHE